MLNKISFKNYKAFKSWQTIDLRSKVTVLVGPNSAGKSSIIKLLGLLKQSIGQEPIGYAHPLLNIRGPIFDMVDFESISYRKELKDMEIEVSSSYKFPSEKNEYSTLVKNIENRFLFTLSDNIGSNKIKQKLISTELLNANPNPNPPLPCKPKKIIKENILRLKSEPYNEEKYFITPYLENIQDLAFKEINSQLSDIFKNQLGEPGFFKNESDLELFIKTKINRVIDASIEKNGLMPGYIDYRPARPVISQFGEHPFGLPEDDAIRLNPYRKAFCDQFQGFMDRKNPRFDGTGALKRIDQDAWIEFPFEFFCYTDFKPDSWFIGHSRYYPVNNRVVSEKTDTLDDFFNAIHDHYSGISEYVDNKKYTDYVSMQIHSYLKVILIQIGKIKLGKKKDIHWKEAFNRHLKSFSVNMSHLFKDIEFSPSIRPKPEKFHSRQDLIDSFAVTPDTNFSFWNNALIDMGFNYELSIENVSKSHDLYAIKLKDTKTQVESYLDEVGYGFSQFLPYLGKKFSSNNSNYNLHIMEQPELHLHPDAQARLPEVLVKSYALNAGKEIPDYEQEWYDDEYYYLDRDGSLVRDSVGYQPKFWSEIDYNSYLIETHSEHILRGVQLLVAKGLVHHDLVKIYYVGKHNNGNSYVKEHPLNEQGKFKDDWPKGFFDVGFNQAAELLRYHRK